MATDNWIFYRREQSDSLKAACPIGEYRVLSTSAASGFLPSGLELKCDSIVLAASGGADGRAYYLVNGNRWDVKAGKIDQEPLGVAMTGDVNTSGILVHHGGWQDRTTTPPPEFLQGLALSGLGNCYPLPTNPSPESGKIADLPRGQLGAFEAVIQRLRDKFPS